jgi:hypothetical protein
LASGAPRRARLPAGSWRPPGEDQKIGGDRPVETARYKEGSLMVRLRLFISSIAAAGLVSAAAGCGDSGDDDDDDDIDASGDGGAIDAGEEPDAAPAMTRSGLIAITETTITNPLPDAPVQGAIVSISYVDDQSVTVPPLPDFDDNPPIGSCLITRYDVKAGDSEPTPLGEGEVIVTGTANGEFSCQYNSSSSEYVCQSTNAFVRGGEAGNAATATVNVNGSFDLLGASFTAEMQGMQILLSGFGKADGIYPVLAFVDADTILLGGVPASAVGSKEATFTTFVGAGPIPTVGKLPVFDFLDDGEATVAVGKRESDLVPEFTVTARARGAGFALSEASRNPHSFPIEAEEAEYFCDVDCGADPEQSADQLEVMVINGETTDGDISKLSPVAMPDPVAAYTTFQCIGTTDSVSITEAGVAAILATNPTRVQVTVGRFVASIETAAGRATTNVVLGHSLTGFTDVQAAISK